jgi:hypothetical protein
MTRIGPARRAAPSSGALATLGPEPAAVHVVGVSASGREMPVYDLTVDGAHEFFANGILVHNSMDAARYVIFGRFGRPPRVTTQTGPGW